MHRGGVRGPGTGTKTKTITKTKTKTGTGTGTGTEAKHRLNTACGRVQVIVAKRWRDTDV